MAAPKPRLSLPAILSVSFAFAFAAVLPRMLPKKPSSVAILVEDGRSGRPLTSLIVEATYPTADENSGALIETDENGRAVFANLNTGVVAFRVGFPDYKDFFQTKNLDPGENEDIVFSLDLTTTGVRGRVLDARSNLPVGGAIVAAGGARGETTVNGDFFLDEVVIGAPLLKIKKEGYDTLSINVELESGIVKEIGEIFLAPARAEGKD